MTTSTNIKTLEVDVAIIGGSLGGVAAALALLEAGYRVVLSDAHLWLGGQLTSQGVSLPDEHAYIETFGGTRNYQRLRQKLRDVYLARGFSDPMPDGRPLNPGDGWVSRLCVEPQVAAQVIDGWLEPYDQLTLLRQYVPIHAKVVNDTVHTVTLQSLHDETPIQVAASYFLDATDLGDLLPLTGTDFVTGAEARGDTGERAAPERADPVRVQSFTFVVALEHRPGESHVIPKPDLYDYFAHQQPYSLTIPGHDGNPRQFGMFTGELPFWSYRRIRQASGQRGNIMLLNWAGNDYRFADLISAKKGRRKRIVQAAKQLTLGFVYWLQAVTPRDEGGFGYPELKLCTDVLGTADGLSQAPYIRESRRIVALERVTANDLVRERARAKPYTNSVGIGWYQQDLHACVGDTRAAQFAETCPFQIPLGSLIPHHTRNLLAACKNIGTTHLSNGAYRVHPVEWAIGEAAGRLARYCLGHTCSPHTVWASQTHTRALQHHLLAAGVPLFWAIDVPVGHGLFVAAQQFGLDCLDGDDWRGQQLELALDRPPTWLEQKRLIACGITTQDIPEDAPLGRWLEP